MTVNNGKAFQTTEKNIDAPISSTLLGAVEGDLYSLQNTELTESRKFIFKLYRTPDGRFFCWRNDPVKVSRQERETKTATVDCEDEVIEFFGKYELSQELYDAAMFISSSRWP
ncbi:MAG: hypothetical protein VYA60_05010 [Pseudomonadota bacterium]|nr:hypothetical protein [Pseudomonadota bacterium]